jgi:hypothetical protein
MAKKIKFASTLTGTIDDLDVLIQGDLVPSPGFVVTFEKTLTASTLTARYQISGDAGTGYSIAYTCSADGMAKSDTDKPTPVVGSIGAGGFKVETLTIPL